MPACKIKTRSSYSRDKLPLVVAQKMDEHDQRVAAALARKAPDAIEAMGSSKISLMPTQPEIAAPAKKGSASKAHLHWLDSGAQVKKVPAATIAQRSSSHDDAEAQMLFSQTAENNFASRSARQTPYLLFFGLGGLPMISGLVVGLTLEHYGELSAEQIGFRTGLAVIMTAVFDGFILACIVSAMDDNKHVRATKLGQPAAQNRPPKPILHGAIAIENWFVRRDMVAVKQNGRYVPLKPMPIVSP